MILSIIIPIYNDFKSLSRLLKNLEKQTIFEIYKGEVEVVVVDDGSNVEIRNKKLETRELNIKFYRIEHGGASRARNFGFKKSSGDYLFFCDADVMFLKNNALEKMIKTLEANPDKAYCYSSFKYGFKTFKLFPFDPEKLKQNNYISTMSLVRREKFPGFDESLKRFQDWDLWLTLLEKGETGIYIPEVLWQAKGGGKISKWLPKIFYKLRFLKSVKEFEKAKEVVKKKHRL